MAFNDGSKEIIACAYKVFNTLGSGYLEKVYENALRIELIKVDLKLNNNMLFQYIMKANWLVIFMLICWWKEL